MKRTNVCNGLTVTTVACTHHKNIDDKLYSLEEVLKCGGSVYRVQERQWRGGDRGTG